MQQCPWLCVDGDRWGGYWAVVDGGFVRVVWMVAGRCQCRGGGRVGQCRPGSYRYQYLVIAAECGGLGLGITAASLTAPRRYFNGLYRVP